MPELLERMRAALGPSAVLTTPEALRPYQEGARYDSGKALAVLRPETTEDVATLVRIAAEYDVSLVPQGANTGLVSGATPDASGRQVVLSLDRLNKGLVIDRDNCSVLAPAGMRLSELNERLVQDGLCFPIDLGADPSVGGMVATNTGGARFIRYGDMRANTLGLTVVLADAEGTIAKLGSGVRKKNTGPDWKQTFIGTSGAFGIVTWAELKVWPCPQQVCAALAVPTDPRHALALLQRLEHHFGPLLTAFEGMSGNAMRAALSHSAGLRNPFAGGKIPDYALLIEVARDWSFREGEAPLEEVLQGVLAEFMDAHPEALVDALFGPAEKSWAIRHALSEGLKAAGKVIAFDLGFRRSDVITFCTDMKARLAKSHPDLKVCDFGHVGDGGVHFNLVAPLDSPVATDPMRETSLRDTVIRVAVEEFGASFSAEHGIGRKNQRYYDHYTSDAEKTLASALHCLARAQISTVRFGGEKRDRRRK